MEYHDSIMDRGSCQGNRHDDDISTGGVCGCTAETGQASGVSGRYGSVGEDHADVERNS